MEPVVVESLVRYVHFFGILLLTSMLVAENILLKPSLSSAEAQKLAVVDGLYGLGAILTLGAGLMLWLSVGKPGAFYTANPLFHAKLTLFLVVAIVSVIPTLFFLKHRRGALPAVSVPRPVVLIKRFELFGISVIPLLAVLMARGIGA